MASSSDIGPRISCWNGFDCLTFVEFGSECLSSSPVNDRCWFDAAVDVEMFVSTMSIYRFVTLFDGGNCCLKSSL